MPETFDSASAATCAAIAQILPVFLVALVAERVVRTRRVDDPIERAQLVTATVMRILLDVAMMLGLVVLMLLALMGIERGGLNGTGAKMLWNGTGLLAVLVMYRWLLFSTPLLHWLNRLSAWYGGQVTRLLEQLLAVLPKGFEWITLVIARIVQFVSEAVLVVIAAGLSQGIASLADWISKPLLRSRQKPDQRDDMQPSAPGPQAPH